MLTSGIGGIMCTNTPALEVCLPVAFAYSRFPRQDGLAVLQQVSAACFALGCIETLALCRFTAITDTIIDDPVFPCEAGTY